MWLDNADPWIEGSTIPAAVQWATFFFDHFLRTYYSWAIAEWPAPSDVKKGERYTYLKKLVRWGRTLKAGRRTFPQLPSWISNSDKPPPTEAQEVADYPYPIGTVTSGNNLIILGPPPNVATYPPGATQVPTMPGWWVSCVPVSKAALATSAARQSRLQKSRVQFETEARCRLDTSMRLTATSPAPHGVASAALDDCEVV